MVFFELCYGGAGQNLLGKSGKMSMKIAYFHSFDQPIRSILLRSSNLYPNKQDTTLYSLMRERLLSVLGLLSK
jgi:hypothetical protein